MKLIDEANKAWRMFSVQMMGVATAVQLSWAALPPEMIASIPQQYVQYMTIGLLVAGIVGRLVKQPSVSGE